MMYNEKNNVWFAIKHKSTLNSKYQNIKSSTQIKNIKKVELISSSHFNIKDFDYKVKVSSKFQSLSSNKKTKINQIINQE